jgi:hypothetical protein
MAKKTTSVDTQSTEETQVTTTADAAVLAALGAQVPADAGFARIQLPRIAFKAKAKFEQDPDDEEKMKVIYKAGSFFTERETDEKDEEGKAVWDKENIGTTLEGIVVYKRKQLRYYDEPGQTFYSTPIFDTPDQIIPLFAGSKKIASGTPAALKKMDMFKYEKEGKTRSYLSDNTVVYLLVGEELFQFSITSIGAIIDFSRYGQKVQYGLAANVTRFTSTKEVKGDNNYNALAFASARLITADEATLVQEKINLIVDAINAEKEFYANMSEDSAVEAAVLALPGDENF